MRLVNFIIDEKVKLGIKVEQGIIDVEKVVAKKGLNAPTTIEQVINKGQVALEQLNEVIKISNDVISEEGIIYAPCISEPGKIICVGLNYISHGEECKMIIPEVPVLFSKFNNALNGHKQEIELPKSAEKFDYEAELVIIIGKEAKNVSKEDALSYVFGYTVGNDFSARDLQMRTGQWLLGKTCDGFAPIGAYLTTADEIDPSNLDVQCKVNGELRQSGNTRDMIFDCSTIVSYISQHMTLKPGDIIFTGTPSGVILGYAEEKQCWLKSEDEIEIIIENLGSLINVLK